jgi:tetratricopeptide (TPR) repeat protein
LTDEELAGPLSDHQREHVASCSLCRARGDAAAPTLRSAAPEPESAPSHDRYVVERELGRGGLGRVLAAHDQRLRRPVALKDLLHRDDDARARFDREAYITARLQHPSIVPLYDVDQWSGGEPFYAMKLVSGRTLDRLVARAAGLDERLALVPNVLAVCEAVAFAHGEGVIHRDLKPANVIIGGFGETVVIDWGLAKELGVADAPGPGGPETDGTLAGTVVGTPAYMPPEQARAEPVDARADVYALGAMLYHVLAGGPPYRARTASATLEEVEAGPPPPLSLRQPGIAQDLLTIVAKAMAREPADRYPSAKELAEELRRFTTGQLVRSHVYSFRQIAWRFLRRNRAAVLVAAVMLGVAVAGGAVALREIVHERNVAEQQRGAAEALVRYSLSGLRDRLERIGHLELLRGIGGEIETYYQTVLANDPRLDDEAVGERAAALEVLANVRTEQGELEPAAGLYRASLALRARQAAARPDAADWGEGLLTCYRGIGEAQRRQGQAAEAIATESEGLALAARLAAEHPFDPAWPAWEATFHGVIGHAETQAGDPARASASYQTALAISLAVAQRDPTDPRWQRRLEHSYALIGYFGNESQSSIAAAMAARVIAQRLAAADPSDTELQSDLGERQFIVCDALRQAGDAVGALDACRAGREVMTGLIGIDASNTAWLERMTDIDEAIGLIEEMIRGNFDGALAAYHRALSITERLAAADPSNARWSLNLASTHTDVGDVERKLGDAEAARADYRRAADRLEALLAEHPRMDPARRALTLTLWGLGAVDLEFGPLPAALARFEQVVARVSTLGSRDDRRFRAHGLGDLGRALAELGALDDALVVARRGLAELDDILEAYPADPVARADRAELGQWLGDILARAGRWPEAIAAYREVLAATGAEPQVLGAAHTGLGVALAAGHDRAGALAEHRAAVAVLEPLEQSSQDERVGAALAAARVELAIALGGVAEARRQRELACAYLEGRRAAGRLTLRMTALARGCPKR